MGIVIGLIFAVVAFGGLILYAYIAPTIEAKKEQKAEKEKLSKMSEKEKKNITKRRLIRQHGYMHSITR